MELVTNQRRNGSLKESQIPHFWGEV